MSHKDRLKFLLLILGVAAAAVYSFWYAFKAWRENRMIAGICAGFAKHYGWDLNLTRVLTFFIILFTGVGVFVYLALWVIIPEAPYVLPAKST